MQRAEVELPGGIRLAGSWRRDAVLRPLTGRDEEFLQASTLAPAARTSAVLARCLCRVGPVSSVGAEIARALSIGDREALLLHLRRLTLGEVMPCLLKCPNADCAEKLDLALQVWELLLPPYRHADDVHEMSIASGDIRYRVRFRLPNGADQEHAAALVAGSPESATELLLRRCVQEIVDEQTGEAVQPTPAPVADALADEMAKLDPQAEIILDLVCPACRAPFRAPFDIADYFHREICGEESDLLRQVHLLAFHYHWSERDILRLSRRKRLRYVELLSSTPRQERLQ
jgi:hypothetical protein